MTPPVTRRAALAVGALAGAAALGGCGDDVAAPPAKADDEGALLGDMLVVERAQVVAYRSAADRARGDARRHWLQQADVERQHIDAIGELLHRIGAPVPLVLDGPGTLPDGDAAVMSFLARLEQRSAAAWRHVVPRTVQDVVRLGCVAILAVEIRQAAWLRLRTQAAPPVAAPASADPRRVLASVTDLAYTA